MAFHSPLRYPGGKGRLSIFMGQVIKENNLIGGDYAELYAGGAGIAISLLLSGVVNRIHINDLNPSIHAFWYSVIHDTEDLCHLIEKTPVNMEQWYLQREIQLEANINLLKLGFSTFFLNRTNRSGIIKAGVIGGKDQKGKWKLDARYNKPDLIDRIKRIGALSNQISLYKYDACAFIRHVLPTIPDRSLVYLDPPYYNKGKELYQNHYQHKDHENIARLVNNIKQPWLITYDNVPEIKDIYSGHRTSDFGLNYSAQKSYKGSELLIAKPDLKLPSSVKPTRASLELPAA
ncbi:DNA adenine methylase [Thalassotalea sp. G20_0]|uniref:DNA adenine methylase n=1 Tax=Thalassotalea sp. G20_0 TaxID=2821093 RepID=UPI001ADCC40A|nr:DNA adenine methylase [Thalassotalea sp. G20_0]MBO9496483.1 DNA adenine methylase [Thalassotalea sp. G20_0]